MLSLRLALIFVSATPAVFLAVPPAHAAPQAISRDIAKVQESYIKTSQGVGGDANALQTAIRRFDPVQGHGPSIYLVAATHIGEKSYYGQLQQFLDRQDVVLYEGVRMAHATTKITTTKVNPSQSVASHAAKVASDVAQRPIGIQKKMANALDLQFQLEGIHYDRPQFRNSDMDWETMTTLAKKAGAGTEKELATLGASMSGLNSGLSGQVLDYVLTQAAAHPFLSSTLRGLLINVLSNPSIAQKNASPDSVKLNAILVVERNKAVLADLTSLLKTSKKNTSKRNPSKRNEPKPLHFPLRSIALFYGAEHMKNIEQHLASDLGYRATSTQWLTAIRAAH